MYDVTNSAFFNLSKRTQNEPNLNPNKPILSMLVGLNLSQWRWFQASFCVPWGGPFPAGWSFLTNFGLVRLRWWSPPQFQWRRWLGSK